MKKVNNVKIHNIDIVYNPIHNKYILRVSYAIQVYETSPYSIETNIFYKCPKEVKEKVKTILKELYESDN